MQEQKVEPPPVIDQDMEMEATIEEPSPEEIIAARRAKRQAILAKYQSTTTSAASTPPTEPSASIEGGLIPPGTLPSASEVTISDPVLQTGEDTLRVSVDGLLTAKADAG